MAERNWPPVSVLNFAGWRVEPQGGATRHSVDLRWPGEKSLVEPALEFGFVGGGCSGAEIATCSAAGCELASGGSTPPPSPTALEVPRGLQVTAVGTDFIEFAWDAVSGATEYDIQLSFVRGDFRSATMATVTATRHRFTVASATTGYARVRAKAQNRASAWSAAVSDTSLPGPNRLGTPRPRLANTGPNSLEWVWNRVPGANNYQYRVSPSIAGLASATLHITSATVAFVRAESGQTLYFQVRAGALAATGPIAGEWSAPVAGTAQ